VLGDRYNTSNFDVNFGYDLAPLFSNDNYYKRFEKNIKIIAFGEYYSLCVSAWAKRLVPNHLKKHGLKVSKVELLPESSLHFKNIGVGINNRYLHKYEKAALNRRLLKESLGKRFNSKNIVMPHRVA
jgi:hypothetical protein